MAGDVISIVIPTLNEEAHLGGLLGLINPDDDSVEVIVSDGGSRDGTVELAGRMGARVVTGARGRGPQLNAGARIARGQIIFFLHADAMPPAEFTRMIPDHARDGTIALLAFRLAIAAPGLPFRLIERAANFRSRVFSMPYGDQGFFMRREVFEKLGGFGNFPIMEDVDFVRRARRLGKIKIIPANLRVSARRWIREGWIRSTARNMSLLALYTLGIPPHRLSRLYPAHSD